MNINKARANSCLLRIYCFMIQGEYLAKADVIVVAGARLSTIQQLKREGYKVFTQTRMSFTTC